MPEVGDPEQRDPDATFPTDEVLRGTKVVEGHGIMKVRAVGDATECGRVYEASRIDNSVKTPLDEQLDRLGRFIAIAMLRYRRTLLYWACDNVSHGQ